MKKKLLLLLANGFALFAMFFGSGNLFLPLKMGRETQSLWGEAMVGFTLTAVLAPLMGFMTLIICKGDYKVFFSKIGKWPALILTLASLMMMGPCGVIPRCFAMTYSACKVNMPDLSIGFFALVACVVTFLATFRENNVIPLLGKVLSPLKFGTILAIFLCGLWAVYPPMKESTHQMSAFFYGLKEGYQTFDLIAAIFFSVFLYSTLSKNAESGEKMPIVRYSLYVSGIAAVLLFVAYLGFCYFTARLSDQFDKIPQELILMELSRYFLGDFGAYATMIIVSFACLTTAIALVTIFSEYLRDEIFQGKLRYEWCLTITLVTSYFFTILGFQGILQMLVPLLEVCYPALIVLCVLNLCHHFFGLRYVRGPFFATLGLTLGRLLMT